MDTTTAIRVDEVKVGTRILYPHQQRNGAPIDKPVTVGGIVEYPATRVLYFEEGGYGVADRHVTFELVPRPLLEVLGEHVAEVKAQRDTARCPATGRSASACEYADHRTCSLSEGITLDRKLEAAHRAADPSY